MGELQVQEIEAIDDYDSSGIAWPWVAIAGACLLLVALLQIEGGSTILPHFGRVVFIVALSSVFAGNGCAEGIYCAFSGGH